MLRWRKKKEQVSDPTPQPAATEPQPEREKPADEERSGEEILADTARGAAWGSLFSGALAGGIAGMLGGGRKKKSDWY